MTLTSPAFAHDGPIPITHSRESGDLSPELRWSGVPAACLELLLTCEDPDAPGSRLRRPAAARRGPPHRYVFTLYALRRPTTLTSGFSVDDLRAALKDNVLATATLIGTYAR